MDLGAIWGDFGWFWGDLGGCCLTEGFGRRGCSSLNGQSALGCIWSVSSRSVSPLLYIIELSSQPVALQL